MVRMRNARNPFCEGLQRVFVASSGIRNPGSIDQWIMIGGRGDMQDDDGWRGDGEAIARILERRIYQRTQGRVHGLRVEATRDRLIVRGCTATYHVKQLALEAIKDGVGPFTVELRSQVDAAIAQAESRGEYCST